MFNELGKGMLDNAWKGYNCSLFAYGQTGSGKSYSIMGNDANKGQNCKAEMSYDLHFIRVCAITTALPKQQLMAGL